MMFAGTLAAGGAAYLWQAILARHLGEDGFSPVANAWAVSFLVYAVLFLPGEQHLAVSLASGDDPGRAGRTTTTLGLFVAACILPGAAGAWLLRGRLFDGHGEYAFVVAAIIAGFGAIALVRGTLSGTRAFAGYGRLTAADSLLRFGLGLSAVLLGLSATGAAWTIPLGCVVVVLWARRLASATRPAPGDVKRIGSHVGSNIVGNLAAQVVLGGGSIAISIAGAPKAAISTLFVVQTALRSILFIAIPFWARLLPTFSRIASEERFNRLSSLATKAAIVGVASAGLLGIAGMTIGPHVFSLVFGAEYTPDQTSCGLVAAGTCLAAANLGLTSILVAAHRIRRSIVAWAPAFLLWVAANSYGNESYLIRGAAAFAVAEVVAFVILWLTTQHRLDRSWINSIRRGLEEG
jgi:O-antigen/teichoic acid export membrane protein